MNTKVIEWVKSIEIPSCKLVTSIEDFHSGVVLCDLAAYAKSRPLFRDVKRHSEIIFNQEASSLCNFSIFLREMDSALPSSLAYRPHELYTDTSKVFELIAFLKKIITPVKKTPVNNENLYSVYQWMKNHQSAPENPENLIEFLSDGVCICQLINKLEFPKDPIKGIQTLPKTCLDKYNNIYKALEFLKEKGKFNIEVDDFLHGNTDNIVNFLLELKASYSQLNKKSTPLIRKITENDSYNIPKIKEWVRKLGISMNKTKLFRGILVAEIVQILEKTEINKINLFPKTRYEARRNFEKALVKLSDSKIYNKYVLSIDAMIDGDKDTVWRLLQCLMDRHLQNNLVDWVVSLGFPYISSIEDVVDRVKNGTVLPEIATSLLKTRIPGVIKKPKNSTEIISNIQKTVEALRRYSGVSHHYLNKDIILRGDSQAIIDLLEEIRKPEVKESCVRKDRLLKKTEAQDYLRKNHSQDFDMKNYFIPSSDITSKNYLMRKTNSISKINVFDRNEIVPKFQPTPKNDYFRKKGNLISVDTFLIRDSSFLKEDNAIKCDFKTKDDYKDAYAMTRMDSFELEDSFCSLKDSKNKQFNWVGSILGRYDLDFDKNTLNEFSDGVYLCQIVNKVGREKINVNMKPNNRAVALKNIDKLLQVLRNKPKFPSYLFFVEEDILNGDGDIVRDVLKHIYDIYKLVIRRRSHSVSII